MPNASPTIDVIRAQVKAIRSKQSAADAKVFGIFTPGRWTGPSIQDVDRDRFAVYQCDSPLQMRLAIQDSPTDATTTVLVTPLDQSKISDDIIVRLAMRKLHPINTWEILRSLFKARHLDPRVARHPFLADLLLEHVASREIPPVAGGLLDADTVWEILLSERLGLSNAHPDIVELLRAVAESDLAGRWNRSTLEFRGAVKTWVCESAGDAAATLVRCLDGEHGARALSIGLAMGVVYDKTVGHELDKAAGRLETYVGTSNLSADIARRWCDASSLALNHLSKADARRCLDEAEAILTSIGGTTHAWLSADLDSGFEQRLSRYGRALDAHVKARASAMTDELRNAYTSLLHHRLGRNADRRMERASMALRLARWVADRAVRDGASTTSLSAIAQQYSVDGGYVDWARRVLRGGEPNKDLAAAYVRLVDRVTELREGENERFGRALADQQALGDSAAGLIPVEQVVGQVVAKIAQNMPVLVLLIDGLSWAVFRELIESINNKEWTELCMGQRRLIGLAALPSITQVCRTSLFCGKLRLGQGSDEVQGFANHVALDTISSPGHAPKLFQKGALESEEDSSLSHEIRAALASPKQRVVGIVINAVDDHLDKGDQIDAVWDTEKIRALEPILSEAGAAGRLIVLLSDHGHVIDRQTQTREPTDGHRWRRPSAAVSKGEIEINSPRVLMPEGGRVVVPWTELLRYGTKKNGYHGGATPQEMLVPISFLWSEPEPPAGFTALVDKPHWWIEPMEPKLSVIDAPAAMPRAIGEKLQPPTLFDQPIDKPATAPEPWITALFQSGVFAVQKKLAGRGRVEEGTIQRLLSLLVSRGGSMTVPAVAAALGMPEHRLPGLLAAMSRLLNVEGYPILDRQDASNTLQLNVALLKKQFELV